MERAEAYSASHALRCFTIRAPKDKEDVGGDVAAGDADIAGVCTYVTIKVLGSMALTTLLLKQNSGFISQVSLE